MIHTTNLENLIFGTAVPQGSVLNVISGYVSPSPVIKAVRQGIKLNVLYGMTGHDGLHTPTHEVFKHLASGNADLNVYYALPKCSVHSKCYVWRHRNQIVKAYVGSANFTYTGLHSPDREVLVELESEKYASLDTYLSRIMNHARIESCLQRNLKSKLISIEEVKRAQALISAANANSLTGSPAQSLTLSFLDRLGRVPAKSGINWGHGTGNVHPDDSCLPIRMADLQTGFFSPKQTSRMPIDAIWDDGCVMELYEEGSQKVVDATYPKQIAFAGSKKVLGRYLRARLGVPYGTLITKHHFDRYGRSDIEITKLAEGSYLLDFSV